MTSRFDIPLDAPLAEVLSKKDAKNLADAFAMTTVADFVGHLPRKYAKRGELTSMENLEYGDHVTFIGKVLSSKSRRMQSRRGTVDEAVISDGRGQVTLTWFNQPFRASDLVPGTVGMFSGKVGFYQQKPQLTHPDYTLEIDAEGADVVGADVEVAEDGVEFSYEPAWARMLIPIYPATAKVRSWDFRTLMGKTLDRVAPMPDPVPEVYRRGRGDLEFDEAMRLIHRPKNEREVEAAQDTLKFTEAFELQAALLQQRQESASQVATARPHTAGGLRDALDASLPFSLTGDQVAVGEEIARELNSETPMHRLLQGEVGSGKTLVAVRAMLQVAESGGQSVLLAPTEVLANQHLRSITEALGADLSARLMPTLLTGALPKAERQRALLRMVTGDARIIVGTHALFSEGVEYDDLGLVVIDEQHRFGVEQREALRRKGKTAPHTLVLTATPIPRTVAMTTFGDLDVSTLRQLPEGRAGISSFVVGLAEHPRWLDRVWQRTAEEISAGRQAFVVCPAIERGQPEEGQAEEELAQDGQAQVGQAQGRKPGEKKIGERKTREGQSQPEEQRDSGAAVLDVLAELRANPLFDGLRIEPLHGRMSADEKDAVMRQYAAGDIDIVVATTVIEVGVNVPNASVMVVLDADRFGVSQLHQLRGRVGRGTHPGVCLLVTRAPTTTLAHARIEAVAATNDGFELAERDVELRREGDVLGTRQSGSLSSLKLLRVTVDQELIADAREAALDLFARDPQLQSAPELQRALERLSGDKRAHLEMG